MGKEIKNVLEKYIKSTSELMKELEKEEISLEEYFKNNPYTIENSDLKAHWHNLIEKSGLSSFDIINRSEFAYAYYYEVVGGKRIPSRDKIIRLILAMHLSLDDCQKTLRICGLSELYPRFRRDSIIIYAINHELTVFELNELLSFQKENELK